MHVGLAWAVPAEREGCAAGWVAWLAERAAGRKGSAMGRRHRKNPRPAPTPAQVNEVTPQVVTDLKGRPLRVRIDHAGFIVDGWGGAHAAAPLAAITRVIAYDIERINPKGPNPHWSGILLLDQQHRVSLRVTGRWDPVEVRRLFATHQFHACTTWIGLDRGQLRKLRRTNRRSNRAPGWRKIRMRSRWLVPWRTAIIVGGSIGLIAGSELGGYLLDDSGYVLGIGLDLAFWYLVGACVPDWIRAFHRRRRHYLQTSG